MRAIAAIDAFEILDSRGNPTSRVVVRLQDGIEAVASVPSGASTGENEAIELRDGEAARYGGKGVLRAIASVKDHIAPQIVGRDPTLQAEIDSRLIELDGTPNKARLGANAILGVSMAVARAAAKSVGLPLYAYLGGPMARKLPMPMMNVINGGMHADNSLDFQEFMIVPVGATSFAEAVRYGAETFHALKALLKRGGFSTGVGDEGGFAPNLTSNEQACDMILEAAQSAGLKAGADIAIALDPAASSFGTIEGYNLAKSGAGRKTAQELNKLYESWILSYPIVSIEDGFAEDDWLGFAKHTAALGDRIQIVGDDLYVTNTIFIERGVKEKSTNAVLIKPNQIGTVTETVEAIDACRDAGWAFVISHRSGETEDTFIADFAVAMGGGQIKIGSMSRGERIAKYNRLLEIERELGAIADFRNPFSKYFARL